MTGDDGHDGNGARGEPPGAGGEGYAIAELRSAAAPGVIGLGACPGLRHGRFRPDLLGRDLDEIKRWGATAAISLLPSQRLPSLPLGRMVHEVRGRGIGCVPLPMEGEILPDAALDREWRRVCGRLAAALRQGDRLLIHSIDGRHLTALVAGWLMIEAGADPDEALAAVRAARPGVVGSEDAAEGIRRYVRQG